MATHILKQVRQALSNLNPNEVRSIAERRLAVRLIASSESGYRAMEEFLSPPDVSAGRRAEQAAALYRGGAEPPADGFDLELVEIGIVAEPDAFLFDPENPEATIREILTEHESLGLPLARYFPAFREPVTSKIIHAVAKENAMFSMVTALPNVAPFLEIPWAIGEFGSDTAFLTVNQIRMTFLLGAASDRRIGYREQRGETASLIAGAFGWRALARELVGKIPFGGGVIPKAAVAFAGTYVVGRSLERFYRLGYGYTRKERRVAYEEAFERGKQVAGAILKGIRARGGKTSREPVDG